jgi:hypothetical protein
MEEYRQSGEEQPRGGSGVNIFWGVIFSALAFVELRRGMLVVSGVPVWALCLFAIGIANFLKYPRIALAVAGDENRLPLIRKVSIFLNISGIAILVVSIAIVYLG